MPDAPGFPLLIKPFAFIDNIGHSGWADGTGVTQPDYGPAHRLDQMTAPAMYRSCAMGSQIHSWHNQGNGAVGDGGWAQAATEFDRQEQVTGYNYTTITQSQAAGVSSYTVTSAAGISPLQYMVIGAGANTEIVQVSASYAGGSPVTLQAPTVNAHTNGDPFYYALKNSGFTAKSSLVVIDTGGNDVPVLGPFTNGTFGTTAGASRGLTPFQHALRFTIAQMRCSVIYKDSHPSCIYAGTWAAAPVSSLATNPPIYSFGGGLNAQYHYSTAAGSTVTFSTAPDFPGGTVCFFSQAYNNPNGAGSLWNFAVTGATTLTLTGAHDNRNANAVTQNDATATSAPPSTGKITGTVYRITGLNPGVNTIVATVGTIQTYGVFLGWGIEAPTPPMVVVAQQFRLGGYGTGYGYGLWSGATYGYIRRSPAATQTATVAAGAGTAAGSVTLGTAVTIGTTGTANTAVYVGDTITIGTNPATMETRRITAVNSTTTVTVDSNFVNAHTGEHAEIGLQDADFVGGGYANTNDTQGATSVPGLNGRIQSVVNEFDGFVQAINFDSFVNPPGPGVQPPAQGSNQNLALDGVHMSDTGGGSVAYGILSRVHSLQRPTIKDISTYTVPNKRTFLPVYGDSYPTGQPVPGAGALAQFVNGWTNYWPMSDGTVMKVGVYKDSRTRMVTLEGSMTNYTGIRPDQLPSPAIILPSGYRPRGSVPIFAESSMGLASMEARADGYAYVTSGFWVLTAPPPTSGGAKIDFYGTWYPEA